MTPVRLIVLLLATLEPGLPQALAERVQSLADSSPILREASWGAKLVDLASGEVLYARHAARHFTPASNTKLFSTALAVSRLGAGHRFTTRLAAEGALAAGVLAGDLVLFGAGDPTLSGRLMPYQYKAPLGDALAPLDELVDQAWRAGLRRVTGDIVGDDTAYVYEPYPEGWALDDTTQAYGAPVSALILHDNAFTLRLEAPPGAGAVRLFPEPASAYFTYQNRVRAAAAPPYKITLDRAPGARTIALWGTLKPASAQAIELAVDDPARYAAYTLRETLLRRGITVDGGFAARHRHLWQTAWTPPPAPAVELARRLSPPLAELIQVTNKVSQNLWAEICLREVARAAGAEPSRTAGLDELRVFLAAMGTTPKEYNFEDGSGLSRLTLVTPAAIVRLLAFMDHSPERAAWLASLPIGGEDGSLGERFTALNHARGAVRAKTGTLTHTAALGGYLETATGRRLAFSVIVNNANSSAAAIRQAIDKLVLLFLDAAG